MSKQQPPRQNWIQMLLIFSAVWLGMMLLRPQQGPAEVRTSQQILGDMSRPIAPPTPQMGQEWDMTKGDMAWANATLNWYTLSQIKNIYEKKVDEETATKEKGLKDKGAIKQIEDSAKGAKLQGDILLSDAQYKYALAHNDTAAMRNAYNSLAGDVRSYQSSPLAAQPFPIPAAALQPERFPWRQWSLTELNDKIVGDLSARNKVDLVYGVFPGYQIIDALVNLTGRVPGFSYAFAAFLLALCVRIIVAPLVQKQLMWGRKMQQLAPLVNEIKNEFKDKNGKVANSPEMQQRTMALYQEYGINPLAGCLPAAIQFPLFITVYQFMLHYQFAFRAGTFLWVNPSTSAATHGFFAPTLGDRDYLLIILYGISMIFSTLLMPVSDPTQVKQQKMMGIGMGLLFTVFMFTGAFPTPAAFVLYWVFTNLLATAQSLRAYRLPIPPLEKVNTKSGGVFPMPPFSGPTTNGKSNGTIQMPKSTGTPAKHRPKKRK